ncbi:hypothetical protein PINS_up023264 [Pythium insidiosum]|nr:hypothetical protein PINS_up023264 [Pythium insidiosum]
MKQQFLDWHQTHLESRLQAFTAANVGDDRESVLICLKRLNAEVLAPLANVFRVYRDNFLP